MHILPPFFGLLGLTSLVAVLIPIVFIICFFGGPFIVVGVCVYFWARTREERYKTVREYLNRGLPVPPEILQGKPYYPPPTTTPTPSNLPSVPQASPSAQPATYSALPTQPTYDPYTQRNLAQKDLRHGIETVALGLAACVLFYIFWPEGRMWAWGLVPIIVGVGYIISARVAIHDSNGNPPLSHPQDPPRDPSSPFPPH